MTLGFALVAALVYLAWLLDRTALLWPAFALALGFASGLSLSGHDAVDPGLVVEDRSSPTGCTSPRRRSGSAGSSRSSPPCGRSRRSCDARRSCASRGWRSGWSRSCSRPGSTSRSCGCRAFSDLWTHDYGQVLLVKIALVALVLAWGAFHHFVVRPRLAGAGDGFMARVGRSVVGRERRRDRGAARGGSARRLEAAAAAPRRRSRRPRGDELGQPRRVGGRGRLVLVAEVDVRRRRAASARARAGRRRSTAARAGGRSGTARPSRSFTETTPSTPAHDSWRKSNASSTAGSTEPRMYASSPSSRALSVTTRTGPSRSPSAASRSSETVEPVEPRRARASARSGTRRARRRPSA